MIAADAAAGVGARPEPDSTLAERARTLWQYGDWDGLARLCDLPFDAHPMRAKLALMVATALFQTGRSADAERFVTQAVLWGCPRDVVARALVAGTLNSLGRLHALRGRDEIAARRFRRALEIGFPGSDHPLTLQARCRQQYEHLGLTFADTGRLRPHHSASQLEPRYAALDSLVAGNRMPAWQSDDEPGRLDLLAAAQEALAGALGRDDGTTLALSVVPTPRGALRLLHVDGDYIPQKMLRESRVYEAEFLHLLEQFLAPAALFVDVGANIGNHTLHMARQPGTRVAAFEPEPHNAVCLGCNLALNGVADTVRVHRVALGARSGTVRLGMAIARNFGSFSSTPESNPEHRPDPALPDCSVAMRTLDEVLATEHPEEPVGIVKIDVEGMEYAVLQGAMAVLERWRPLVATESFHVDDYRRIEALLAPLGYAAIALCNATPTFVFVSDANPFHARRLMQHLRQTTLSAAARRQGFATTP